MAVWILLAGPHLHGLTLSSGEADIQVRFAAGAWTWSVLDENGESHALEEVIFDVPLAARQAAPADPEFSAFLGAPGAPVWILPQGFDGELLFLGLDGSPTGPGIFADNQLTLTLTNFSGPGAFSLFQVDSFGTPRGFFNTRDGVDPAQERVTLSSASGHEHYAWAFSEPGVYTLSVAPSATLREGGVPVVGAAVEWRFEVVPEPSTGAMSLLGALGFGWRRFRRAARSESARR